MINDQMQNHKNIIGVQLNQIIYLFNDSCRKSDQRYHLLLIDK